jgi:hypothetical protein
MGVHSPFGGHPGDFWFLIIQFLIRSSYTQNTSKYATEKLPLFLSRLLLRQAMQGAKSPHQINRMNPDHRSVAK